MLAYTGVMTTEGQKELSKFFTDSVHVGVKQHSIPLSTYAQRHVTQVLHDAVRVDDTLLLGSKLDAALRSEGSVGKGGLAKLADSVLFTFGYLADRLGREAQTYYTKGRRIYQKASEAHDDSGATIQAQIFKEIRESFYQVAEVLEDVRVKAELMHALRVIQLDTGAYKDPKLLLMDPYVMRLLYECKQNQNKIATRVLEELGVPLGSDTLDATLH